MGKFKISAQIALSIWIRWLSRNKSLISEALEDDRVLTLPSRQ